MNGDRKHFSVHLGTAVRKGGDGEGIQGTV